MKDPSLDEVQPLLPSITTSAPLPHPSSSSSQCTDDINPCLSDNGISKAEQARKIARNTIYGMILVAIGQGFFTTVGAIVQNHGGSVLELLLGRYIFQNIISWLIWFFKRPSISSAQHWYGDKPFRINIWTRGFLYWIMIFCWFRGLELVPIGDAEAIVFLSPLVTVIAARIYLKENLPKVFYLTFFLTIIGVTFICQPAFVFGVAPGDNYESISWIGLLFLLGTVFSWSAVCILVRTAKEAHWLQLELVSSGQSAYIWTPLLILLNRFWFKSDGIAGGEWEFDWDTLGIIVILSILGFFGLMFNVIGYQIGDATKVAWMEYLDLVFAFIYQWFAFNDEPNIWEFIGCGLLFTVCFVHVMEEVYVIWKKRIERNKLENETKIDNMILKNTSFDISNGSKDKVKILHYLDSIPKESNIKLGKEKIESVVDRLTSFASIRKDSEYQSL